MRKQRRAERRQYRQCLAEIALGNVQKLFDAAGNEKAFESDHAGFPQWPNLAQISWNKAAPEAHVPRELSCRSRKLFSIGRNGRYRGDTVQRHFDERRYAPGRRSSCG